MNYLESNWVPILISFLSGGTLSGVIVARYNWYLKVKEKKMQRRKELISGMEHFLANPDKRIFEHLRSYSEYQRIKFKIKKELREDIDKTFDPPYLPTDPDHLKYLYQTGTLRSYHEDELAELVADIKGRFKDELVRLERKWNLI